MRLCVLHLSLLTVLLPSPAGSQGLDQAAADGRRFWDGAAGRGGVVAAAHEKPAGAAKAPQAPGASPATPTQGRLLWGIDRLLSPQSKTQTLREFLDERPHLTAQERASLERWRVEIMAEGEGPWLKKRLPPPGVQDSRMLAQLKAAIPDLPADKVFFIPFEAVGRRNLLARAIGNPDALGFTVPTALGDMAFVDDNIPGAHRWAVTVHEALHMGREDVNKSGIRLARAVEQASGGRCPVEALAGVRLASYLIEGYTQRRTLEVLHKLLRAGLDAAAKDEQRASLLRSLAVLLGRASPVPADTPLEVAGRALYQAYAGEQGGLPRRLADMPSPEAVIRGTGERAIYARQVAAIGAWAKDPGRAAVLEAWVKDGVPEPLVAALGWEKALLLIRIADQTAVFRGFGIGTWAGELGPYRLEQLLGDPSQDSVAPFGREFSETVINTWSELTTLKSRKSGPLGFDPTADDGYRRRRPGWAGRFVCTPNPVLLELFKYWDTTPKKPAGR